MGPDPPISYSRSHKALYYENSQQLTSSTLLFILDWNDTVPTSKNKMHKEHVYSRIHYFQLTWFTPYLVSFIRKYSKFENKIRNHFIVRSWHNNMLQQHANITNESMLKNCWKTQPIFCKLNKACEMEWLCNDTSLHLTWKQASKISEKEK